ncbi:putative carboxylesterase 15 [Dichanthelium oligosanthes]|uniref:Putative carboxylesterase 15 n=1 Tax=Dichanthelium oligosanthes TaxID=888268 RepID=A0A1E5VR04_9POAL|nr:putative carboxylesterase 15 [Dichanthelium oligosanthes]
MNARFFGTPSALRPVQLRGFVLLMPFFIGAEPTPSELACPDDAFLSRDMSDRYVWLSLPAGATAGHPFLNPFSPDAPGLDVGPTLVVVAGDDLMRDGNREYARRMKEMGKPVEAVEFPGQQHAFFSIRPWSEPVDEMRACHCHIDMPSMPAVSAAAGEAPPPAGTVVEDIYGFLRVLNDGTVLRSAAEPMLCPATFPKSHPSVEWKEAVYDKAKSLRVRMYKPSSSVAAGGEAGNNKLPVLVHFHGGGFCLGSCTWANVHAFCLRLAAEAGAVVLSAGYRLAPEHRLPTAFDDGAAFLRWLREQSVNPAAADVWLTEAADFARVFVTGDSAGGTIAHHLAVRAGLARATATKRGDLDPVTVRGYVLLMPFFGGVLRTRSEAECHSEVLLNLDLFDRFWRLSLPAGATRDHPAANPFGPDSPDLAAVDFRAPVLVVVGGLDMMRDRAVDYAERLAAMGKPVEVAEFAGEPHGFYALDPGSDATGELIGLVSRFVHSCGVKG